MTQGNEASVEEILESIKKVIARDNREGAMETRRKRLAEQKMPAPDVEDAEEILDLAEMEFQEDLDGSPEDYSDDEIDDEQDDEDIEPPLTKDAVRSSMRDNFAALAMLAEPGAQPQIVRSGETSLEGMVRDMLRPMLADWLDKNLPNMVETMVQKEIARIAGKKR